MGIYQPISMKRIDIPDMGTKEKLAALLGQDLDFREQNSGYASHHFYSFPAKFPPQLPHKFIQALTLPGDVVLDPMMGSGTTVLEAFLTGRQGLGLDIDPLALMLTKTKVTPLKSNLVAQISMAVVQNAAYAVRKDKASLEGSLQKRWDAKTRAFVDYWFARET